MGVLFPWEDLWLEMVFHLCIWLPIMVIEMTAPFWLARVVGGRRRRDMQAKLNKKLRRRIKKLRDEVEVLAGRLEEVEARLQISEGEP